MGDQRKNCIWRVLALEAISENKHLRKNPLPGNAPWEGFLPGNADPQLGKGYGSGKQLQVW